MEESLEDQLTDDIASYVWNPYGYTQFAFPWGEEGHALEKESIRDWQVECLSELTMHLSNPLTRHQPFMLSRASGHGIGKSALFGMLSKWGLDTFEDTRVIVTANTEGQLKTKTMPEISKWHRWAITHDWFKIEKTSIHAYGDKEDNWRLDFIPWSEHNTEAFAGLHNKDKRIIIIMDEGSAIADAIWEVTEGALTDENTEIIWIVFGNPTRNIGRFRETFRRHSGVWNHAHIDSRDVEGTNKDLFARWAKQYGEDSDFYRVRVKGQFPNVSDRQFYPTDLIEKARAVDLKRQDFDFAPVIISVDPSWTGSDAFVIGLRQGLMYRTLATFAKNDNDIEMGNIIARHEDEQGADAVFIDGGYGTGIVSAGRVMNRNWQLVWFGEASARLDCINKRAEMHVLVLEWLQQGGSIEEDDDELYEELIAIEAVATMDGKYKMPDKKLVKELIGRSPNKLDALAITFAFPVKPRPNALDNSNSNQVFRRSARTNDYNPLDR